ncbi:MAG: type III-A CRISPR-associated protein Csm2 [Prevotellaceae bacterium]|nr:type III-A CRISPR-associated protein Csm2 [Candidatus Minthosoma caballi]
MAWNKNDLLPENEIKVKVTDATVKFAERFGKYLGSDDIYVDEKGRKQKVEKLTTSQLRKFFGEVKRQQMVGYKETDFVLLKPKLAYAVGRAKGKQSKIGDFYIVLSDMINKVTNEDDFKRFIKAFEAIVAYHKASEEAKDIIF